MKHGNTIKHTDVSRRGGAFLAVMALAFALVASAALISCKSNALGDSDRSGGGTGSLAVAIADTASSRLVMPSLPTAATVAGYEITLSREGYATRTTGRIADLATFTMQALEPGNWNLALAAFDSGGTRVAEGTASVTIERDATVTATVALVPAFARTAGGTGTVSLVFACSGFLANSNDWRLALTPSAGGTSTDFSRENGAGVTIDPVANTIAISATLASGDWDMTFSVKVGITEYVTATDVVKVYDGKTSVTATGSPIAISVANLMRADRVFYVSNTATAGNSGRDRAHACQLGEAIGKLNGKGYLTDTDPGVIILTENVEHNSIDGFTLQRPFKITSLSSSATSFSITGISDIPTAFFVVVSDSGFTGRLTVERATITMASAKKAAQGLVHLVGTDGNARLTLGNGAKIAGNQGTMFSGKGGVYVQQGTCVMEAGSEISGNWAEFGGGVYLETAQALLTINSGLITGNFAGRAGGGAYSAASGAKIGITGGSIAGNTVDIGSDIGVGGGVVVHSPTDLTVGPAFAAGWKDAIRDNVGNGPDVVLRVPITTPAQYGDVITGSYPLPVAMEFMNAFTLPTQLTVNNPSGVFVLTGTTPLFTISTNAMPLFTVTAGTVYVNSRYTYSAGAGQTSSSLLAVSGTGTLVLTEECSLGLANGNGLGGAIRVDGGTFRMEGGVIQGCVAANGGAIAVTAGTATITEGLISDCVANSGGAISLSGGSLTIEGGLIGQNSGSTNGGAIYVTGGTLSVSGGEIGYDEGGTLKKNTAGSGGGGGIFASAGTVALSGDAMIRFNQATGTNAMGGGIAMTGTSALTIAGTDVRIDKNEANMAAGGVLLKDSATMTVTGATWGDVIKTNVAGLALPDLARYYGNVSIFSGIENALAASEPAIVSLQVNLMPEIGEPLIINKPFAIVGQAGCGFTRGDGTGEMFVIGNVGTLTLSGTLAIDGSNISSDSPLVRVMSGGTFVMDGANVSLTNNNGNSSVNGGAVYVDGTFRLKNGTVGPNNKGLNGAGVYVDLGEFYMTGGSLTQNFANSKGGGLYVGTNGKAYVYGGIIQGNTAGVNSGGGIYVNGNLWLRNYATSLENAINGNSNGGLVKLPTGFVWFSTEEEPSVWTPIITGSESGFSLLFSSNLMFQYLLN